MAQVATPALPTGEPMAMKQPERNFHLFAYLSEDLKMAVLSFLADAPFEKMPENYSSSFLTHNMPRVNQKFRTLAASDLYWKDAVVRQTKKEPFLWKPALYHIRTNRSGYENIADEEEKEAEELVEDAYSNHECTDYKSFYQNIVTQYLRYKGPVFAMEGQGTCNERRQEIKHGIKSWLNFCFLTSLHPRKYHQMQSVWENPTACTFLNPVTVS